MKIKTTEIADTFAEAFSMRFTRIIVTAINLHWLSAAIDSFCGYGTSVIACDAEVGVEEFFSASESPDGRPGAKILLFGFSEEAVQKALSNRTSQCLLTCPTTAVFSGLNSDKQIELGNHIRYFGDGFQKSKIIGDRRYWRIPVMDGEFLIEESTGIEKGVAGGNFLIESMDQISGLEAAQKAVEAIAEEPNVITPFPGGVVRSGSKVGSRYKGMVASTSDPFCPSLKGRVESKLHPQANCVYEIVIDGTNSEAVGNAIRVGIQAAVGDGIERISAGNYGGKLGKHHFYLQRLMEIAKN